MIERKEVKSHEKAYQSGCPGTGGGLLEPGKKSPERKPGPDLPQVKGVKILILPVRQYELFG